MAFLLELADRIFEVDNIYPEAEYFCRDYIADNAEDAIKIKITEDDILLEKKFSENEDVRAGTALRDFPPQYLEILALYRKIAEILIDYDTVLFHGSCICVENRGYLFTAKSGTGKSTHTRLWRELLGNSAVMINDDKPLLKITDNSVVAYGTPWNGKHKLSTNRAVVLKSVCLLNRGKENCIEKIDNCEKKEYYPQIFSQIYRSRNPERLKKTFILADTLIKNVDLFNLYCNMDISAAKLSYNAMKG